MNQDLPGDSINTAAVIFPLSPSSNEAMCLLSSSWVNDQAKNNSLLLPAKPPSQAQMQMLKRQFL